METMTLEIPIPRNMKCCGKWHMLRRSRRPHGFYDDFYRFTTGKILCGGGGGGIHAP